MRFPDVLPRSRPDIRRAVDARWNSLTKPPGSLGLLESLVADVAEMRADALPSVKRKAIYVFCADHGSTASGVSAWPSEVTAQMVRNFVRGGAAISVLGRSLGIALTIVDAGVLGAPVAGTLDRKIAPGTRNFVVEPAMSRAQALTALDHGLELAAATEADLLGLGEMGIGNTASASALACALAGLTPEEAVGRGAGLSAEGLLQKRDAVASALHLHRDALRDPIDALAAVGGFEIAMMAGFVIGSASRRIPIVVDGFITTAAILVARALAPNVTGYLLYSHVSAEHAHRRLLRELGASPMLDFEMRLGEGTAAALAMSLIEQALALYHGMATFQEAQVAESNEAHA